MCNICIYFEIEIFYIMIIEIGIFVLGLYSLGKLYFILYKMFIVCLSVRS